MPTFAEFETYGEPLVVTDERRYVVTVWQARKSGGDPRLYVIKCYAPRVSPSVVGQETEALAKDQGLEFLEGIKQIKKAQSEEGGRNLAPIHALGKTESEAWYVTDHYPRNNLKAWVDRRGGVDSDALRHVVQRVVAGCLALKRSRGYSHGNLKPSNVFLVGPPNPLKKTPLVLTDAYPAAPLKLAALGPGDRKEATQLLTEVVEAQDLRNLGELILQLVEGRLFARGDDYNYPVARSSIWDILGKDADYWLKLCNELVDPRLSLQNINLESLAHRFRSRLAGVETLAQGLRSKLVQSAKISGAIIAVGVLGFIVYKYWKSGEAKRHEYQAAVKGWSDHQKAAGEYMGANRFAEAATEFSAAREALGKWGERERQKIAQSESDHETAANLQKAKDFFERKDWSNGLPILQNVAHSLTNFPETAGWVASQALDRATNCVPDWEQATQWLGVASSAKPGDHQIDDVWSFIAQRKNQRLHDQRWAELQADDRYKQLLTDWRANNVQNLFTNMVYQRFLGVFTSDTGLSNLKTALRSESYAFPETLKEFSKEDRETELNNLISIAAGKNLTETMYAGWREPLRTNYGPVSIDALVPSLAEARKAATNKWSEVNSKLATKGNCPQDALNKDKDSWQSIGQQLAQMEQTANKPGANHQAVKKEATAVLEKVTNWTQMATLNINNYSECETHVGFDWFTESLKDRLKKLETNDTSFEQVCDQLSPYTSKISDATRSNLLQFKTSLLGWWPLPQLTVADLPGSTALSAATRAAEDSCNCSQPNYTSDATLVASVQARLKYKQQAAEASQSLNSAWNTVNDSVSKAPDPWAGTGAANGFAKYLARLDFQGGISANVSLPQFSKAANHAAETVLANSTRKYYAPPDLLSKVESDDLTNEMKNLERILATNGISGYAGWRDKIAANYAPILALDAVLPNWNAAGVGPLRQALVLVKAAPEDVVSGADFSDLERQVNDLSTEATALESAAKGGGRTVAKIRQQAGKILDSHDKLSSRVATVSARLQTYGEVSKKAATCDYDSAIRICRENSFKKSEAAMQAEKSRYDVFQTQFQAGHYDFLENPSPSEPCLSNLFVQAKAEKTKLDALTQLKNLQNWPALLQECKVLPEDLRRKGPFSNLVSVASQNDPQTRLKHRLLVLQARTGTAREVVRDEKGQPITKLRRGSETTLYENEADYLEKEFSRLSGGKLAPDIKQALKDIRSFLTYLNQ